MRKNFKVNKGITLIALVITIIVLLILAGVTVSTITGKNGILNNSIQAKENTRKSEIINSAKIDILKKQKLKRKYGLSEDELNNILIKYGTVAVGATNIFDGTLITEEEYQIPVKDIYDYDGTVVPEVPEIPIDPDPQPEPQPEPEPEPEPEPPPQPPVEPEIPSSFIGCYADFEGDGTPDGIIFADLAVGGTGTWNGERYNIPNETGNLKNYRNIGKKSDSRFGNTQRDVIAPVSGTYGKERFYVMALSDEQFSNNGIPGMGGNMGQNNNSTWYAYAGGKMNDWNTYTSTAFGKGKTNTERMIAKRRDGGYGYGAPTDLWIKDNIINKNNNGWFVPAKDEFYAFLGNLGINSNNYRNYNLTGWYWTSSQKSSSTVWKIALNTAKQYDDSPKNMFFVRLGKKF